MVMNDEDGLECEVFMEVIRLEHVSEFKCLGCVLDYQVEVRKSVVGK